METFGDKLKRRRELKNLSQSKLAELLGLHPSIIGRYERNQAKPTIDVVKNMAKALDTSVGYLLGENEDAELLKDTAMLNQLKELSKLPEHDRNCILYTLDSLLQNVKTKQAFAQ
jgi:transcriptional regulator with XRE-family HTH domain